MLVPDQLVAYSGRSADPLAEVLRSPRRSGPHESGPLYNNRALRGKNWGCSLYLHSQTVGYADFAIMYPGPEHVC